MTIQDQKRHVNSGFSELQLDALRELANIASGTAATSLSQLLGRDVDLSVPKALALPLADAAAASGGPSATVTGVALELEGDIDGAVLLLIDQPGAQTLCSLLGVDPESELGGSALAEIGNILAASYLKALSSTTGLALIPSTPTVIGDLHDAAISSSLATLADHGDTALVLDSELDITGEPCAISFLLLPAKDGVTRLLAPLGLSGAVA